MTAVKTKKKISVRSILKWIGIVIAVLVGAVILTVVIARTANWAKYRMTGENSVDEGVYVDLGGQEQFLRIRGEDMNNPVLIWLHGGPAGNDGYINHLFQRYLVDEYTIINWDQRGCGRTYYRNKADDPENSTASFEQAQIDLDELVDYACERFGREKVIIVGHSYGTMVGSRYALDNPEKVAAYIGVGQFVDIESDIYAYEDSLRIAKEKGDDTSAMEQAYQRYLSEPTLVNLMALRNTTGFYHIVEKTANTIWEGIASPYMGFNDIRWFFAAMDMEQYFSLNPQLFDYIMVQDVRDYGTEYQVPVGFISGEQDWVTPVKYAEDYCALITAPEKSIVLINGCGHSPQLSDPEAFSDALRAMLENCLE